MLLRNRTTPSRKFSTFKSRASSFPPVDSHTTSFAFLVGSVLILAWYSMIVRSVASVGRGGGARRSFLISDWHKFIEDFRFKGDSISEWQRYVCERSASWDGKGLD